MMTASDRIAALAAFFSCSREEATKVDAATRLAHYRHKDILAHQGDLGAKLWIVLEGRAQLQIIGICGQAKLLAAHGPGELFGACTNSDILRSISIQNLAFIFCCPDCIEAKSLPRNLSVQRA